MLWKFEVENFFSIRDRQTLDLVVGKGVSQDTTHFRTPISGRDARVASVAAIFGANASGKSNLIRAMPWCVWFIKESFDWDSQRSSGYLTFNHRDYFSAPTRFHFLFDAQIIEDEPHCLYSYELVMRVSSDYLASNVEYEALKYAPHSKFKRIFERRPQGIQVGEGFGSVDAQIFSYVKPYSSVISTLSKLNNPLCFQFVQSLNSGFLTNILANERTTINPSIAASYYARDPDAFKGLKNQISKLDLGISDVSLLHKGDATEIEFTHEGLSGPVQFDFESDGTKSFLCSYVFLDFVLRTGGLVVLDEFDRDIHPILLPELLGWFRNSDKNPFGSQIIISAHNATLLEHLVKEEVHFAEKDRFGCTHIYGLKDVKGVRRDENLYAKYLSGEYGAIPQVG